MLISRISLRISNGTVGLPPRAFDFQRQYKSEACAMPFDPGLRLDDRQRIANGRARPIEANKNQSVDGAEGLFLRSGSPQTFICCRNVRISASSAARARTRSATIQTMSLTRSLIRQQHRPILDQLLVRLSLRQGQRRQVPARAKGT